MNSNWIFVHHESKDRNKNLSFFFAAYRYAPSEYLLKKTS